MPFRIIMTEIGCRFKHVPYVYFRIQLLWTRRYGPTFQKLSLNITREVCNYYTFLPDVLARPIRDIWAFQLSSKTWKPFQIWHRFDRIISAVFVGEAKVFLVLTNITSAYEDPPYYAMYESGDVTKCGGFQQDRYSCGVAYDQIKNCVYILGGRDNCFSDAAFQTKLCSRFALSSYEEEPLPDMLVGRCDFGLCWHQRLLYLCAGSHPSVHTFDPVTLAHSSCCRLDIEAEDDFLAVSYNEEVVILSRNMIWRGQGQQWRKELRKEVENEYDSSIGSPVLLGDSLYYSYSDGCAAFNLDTGEVRRYVFNRAND